MAWEEDKWGTLSAGKPVKAYTPTKQPLCLGCSHLTDDRGDKGEFCCEAFPKGIPDKFWSAKIDHTAPYDGDNGITFDPKAS